MTFDWLALSPVLVLAGMSLVVLLVDAFSPTRRWAVSTVLSVATLVAAGVLTGTLDARLDGEARSTMCTRAPEAPGLDEVDRCSFAVDGFSVAMWWILLAAALLVVLMAGASAADRAMPPGELHFLLLASVTGALSLAASRDLVSLVVSLELVSLPSIAMVALRREDRAAARSGWTFFLASVTATAFMLMGIALVYGATGSLHFDGIGAAIAEGAVPAEVLRTGVVLVLAGLVFKVGAVPFHMWVPDTYGGATPAVAAYLSVVSKTAGFAGILILLAYPFTPLIDSWSPLVAVVAGLTMTVGNVAALRSRDAVGLLAWSSVAQAGFVLAPVAALLAGGTVEDSGLAAAVRYLGVYAIANLAAFAVVAHVRERTGRTDLEAFRGLLRRDRLSGITLAAALLALAGFPPAVIGLVAKYVVLAPVVSEEQAVLAVVMAVNVAIGLAYYLRLLVLAVSAGEPLAPGGGAVGPRLAMGLALSGLVALSVWPALLTSVLL
jgi:NADH-quinone oxidoreductase subunit N